MAGAAARAACAHACPLAGPRCTRRALAGLLRGVHARGRCGTIACALPLRKGVLPKDYARPGLDKQRFGQLINLVSDIGLGKQADRAKDILGRVYEYFLAQLATAEGKKGGQFYTPSRVVRVLVEILAPYRSHPTMTAREQRSG